MNVTICDFCDRRSTAWLPAGWFLLESTRNDGGREHMCDDCYAELIARGAVVRAAGGRQGR